MFCLISSAQADFFLDMDDTNLPKRKYMKDNEEAAKRNAARRQGHEAPKGKLFYSCETMEEIQEINLQLQRLTSFPFAFMLLNVHGGEMAYWGRGQSQWEGDERVKGSTAETARKRPERPWTAARTMEVLRRCPLAIAQRLVHCAIALSTAVLDRVTKTISVAPLLTNNLDNSKQKTSNLLNPAPPPYS